MDDGRVLAPIDLRASQRDRCAKIDFEPGPRQRRRDPRGRIKAVGDEPGIAAAAENFPPALVRNRHTAHHGLKTRDVRVGIASARGVSFVGSETTQERLRDPSFFFGLSIFRAFIRI